MSSVARRRRALERWDAIARGLGLFASLLIVFAAVAVLLTDTSMDTGSHPYGVPSRYYLALALIAAAVVVVMTLVAGHLLIVGTRRAGAEAAAVG